MSNILTDEQVEQLSESLSNHRSEDNKAFQEMPSNQGVEERIPEDPNAYEEEVVTKFIDPMTGNEHTVPDTVDPLNNINIDTSGIDSMINMSEDDIMKMDVDLKQFEEAIPEGMRLTKADKESFKRVFERYRRGEDFSLYNSLPTTVKKYVDETVKSVAYDKSIGDIKEVRSVIIKSLFESLMNDIYLNKTYNDLNTMVSDTYNDFKKSVAAEESTTVRKKIAEFPKIADNIREENPEKAEELDKFCEAYKESYEYNKLEAAIKTGKLRSKRIEIEKFDRTCNGYHRKFEKSTKIIDAVNHLPDIISRHIECSLIDAKRIVVSYVKYVDYAKLNIDKLDDYCFMYYFAKNIINLDNYSETSFTDIKFYSDLKTNLKHLLYTIHSIEDNIVKK